MAQTESLSKAELESAYRDMKTIRVFEERVVAEIFNGQIAGFTHVYTGQEANAVGVCALLSGDDSIISTHRGHGHCIARGADVMGMMKELWGSSEGLCKGKGGSMHIADVDAGILGANGIVAGGPPIAVGAALGYKQKQSGNVAVSFSGDGSVNQGTCFEAMNLAVVLKVPAIFVIENNRYSEHTSVNYAIGCDDLKRRTEGFGFPVFDCDGTDYFSVRAAMQKAREHVEAGNGPAGVICDSERFDGHFVGDPQGYRQEGELDYIRKERCCLNNFRQRMAETGELSDDEMDAIDQEVEQLIEDAVAAAKAAPRPDPAQVAEDVYINYAG